MADPIGPLKQTVYMPDTNVVSMLSEGHPVALAEVELMEKRGIKFVVPNRTIEELKNDPDPQRRAAQLAFVRDAGWDVQGKTPSQSEGYTERFRRREVYNKLNPQMKGKDVSDATIDAFVKSNPEAAKRINNMGSAASKAEQKQIADVYHYANNEGKPKDVHWLTFERVAGGGTGDPNKRAAIARNLGVKVAPESRVILRPGGTVAAQPIHIWETSRIIRLNRAISNTQVGVDGALTHVTPPPPRPSTPPAKLRFRGTLGSGLKLAGGMLANILTVIVLRIILKPIMDRLQKESFDREMREQVQPKMIAAIEARKESAFELLKDGKKAFAKVQIKYYIVETPDIDDGRFSLNSDGLTHVTFEKLIEFVDQPMSQPTVSHFSMEDFDGSRLLGAGMNPRLSGERHVSTLEVIYDQEEVELYKFYKEIISNCTLNFLMCVNGPDMQTPERIELQKFWQDRHKEYVDKLDAALRNGRPPTII